MRHANPGARSPSSACCSSPLLVPSQAFAEDVLDSGDTAWMLTSSALVLLMTLPGLALFYGGLVRTKNVLSVLMQCLDLRGRDRRALGGGGLQPLVRRRQRVRR